MKTLFKFFIITCFLFSFLGKSVYGLGMNGFPQEVLNLQDPMISRMVLLVVSNNNNNTVKYCGGILILYDLVLTTPSCFVEPNSGTTPYFKIADNIQVYLSTFGNNALNRVFNTAIFNNFTIFTVNAISFYDSNGITKMTQLSLYNSRKFYDLALLRLNMNSYQQNLDLANYNMQHITSQSIFYGVVANNDPVNDMFFYGFGAQSKSVVNIYQNSHPVEPNTYGTLRSAHGKMIFLGDRGYDDFGLDSINKYRDKISNIYNVNIIDILFGTIDGCFNGDYGSPLLSIDPTSDTITLFGILSRIGSNSAGYNDNRFCDYRLYFQGFNDKIVNCWITSDDTLWIYHPGDMVPYHEYIPTGYRSSSCNIQ